MSFCDGRGSLPAVVFSNVCSCLRMPSDLFFFALGLVTSSLFFFFVLFFTVEACL